MSALCLPGTLSLKSEMQFASVQESHVMGKRCIDLWLRETKVPTAHGGHVGGSQQQGVGQSSGLLPLTSATRLSLLIIFHRYCVLLFIEC